METPNLYLIWLGDVEMTPKRKECHQHILDNCPFNIHRVTDENLCEYIQEGFPLHEAYKYLSIVHRFDYLCNYLAYHVGGIFIGIKKTYNWELWKEYYNKLHDENNDLWVCSSRGWGPWGLTAYCAYSDEYPIYVENWEKIFGHIGWMCKKKTPIFFSPAARRVY